MQNDQFLIVPIYVPKLSAIAEINHNLASPSCSQIEDEIQDPRIELNWKEPHLLTKGDLNDLVRNLQLIEMLKFSIAWGLTKKILFSGRKFQY